MRVRADHPRDAAVELPAHRDFFRRRLGVEIEKNQVTFFLHLAQQFLDLLERIVERRHERAAREVHDADVLRLERIAAPALARRIARVVRGTNQERLLVDELEDIFLVPDMVARRHDVCAALIELVERLAREALACRRVFAVHDDDIDAALRAELRRILSERPAAVVADDVTDEHDFHLKLSPTYLESL